MIYLRCDSCTHDITSSVDCSCHCHQDLAEGNLTELIESTYDSRSNVKSQIQNNKFFGKLAEIYSRVDFNRNGFFITPAGSGFDFIATNGRFTYFVEVKFNTSRLSKLQRSVQGYCKKNGFHYFVYRVTPAQLEFWLWRFF